MMGESIGGVAGVIAIIGAVSTAVGGIAGFWATKGVEAKIRLMAARKESNLEGLEAAKAKATALQEEIAQIREDHEECMTAHAATREELALLRGRLEVMEALVRRSPCPLVADNHRPQATDEQSIRSAHG